MQKINTIEAQMHSMHVGEKEQLGFSKIREALEDYALEPEVALMMAIDIRDARMHA